MRGAFAVALLLAGEPAVAQTVSLSGSFGSKALLIIDGTPRTLAVGATERGVRLVSVGGSEAVVEVKGQRVALAMAGAQVNLGGAPSEGGGMQIVLAAGSGGHFVTSGSINGRAVRFLVDTGATSVSMSQAQAEAIGLDYRAGRRGTSTTANGTVAVHRVTLASVRIGDVRVYEIEATILPMPMEFILLGNSYLTRFQMRRDNDTLTLTKRL